jgi:PAS domain S-box-containing protein
MRKKNSKYYIIKYSLIGLLFGICFPIVGYLCLRLSGQNTTVSGLIKNPLFVIVCLAPPIMTMIGFVSAKIFSKTILKLVSARDLQISIIQQTVEFTEQIGHGNYRIEFDSKIDNPTLRNALTSMRDNLQKSHNDEQQRAWIMSGLTETGEILRRYNKVDELSKELVPYLTNKITATQCAFYRVNTNDEQDIFIELVSSYAYKRAKHLRAKFKPGQGLVGQAMLEQDIIHRNEIPDYYTTITSGLIGEKKPDSLLIVPLITNEKVFGLLEFASIHPFESNQIQFLREASEIIARTMFNLSVNERTLELLNQSERMSRELEAQRTQLLKAAEEMQLTQQELRSSNENLEIQIGAVQNATKRQQVLLERASEIIAIHESNGRFRYVSPSVYSILGYDSDEIIQMELNDVIHPLDVVLFEEVMQKVNTSGQDSLTIKLRFIKKDESEIWVESTVTNLNDDPAIRGIINNIRDITSSMQAENERMMRGQMQSLSENSMDLIIRVDIHGHVFYCNPIIKYFAALQIDEILQDNFRTGSLPPDLVLAFEELIAIVRITFKRTSIIKTLNTFIGQKIYQLTAIPELNGDSELETMLIIAHDITEQKENENQIREKNKNITESINYSYRIQSSLLPTENSLKRYFPSASLYYKPRDIVSGDFPFVYQKGAFMYLAVVDCTGHGVPGALMSFIGYFTLNEILSEAIERNAAEVLDELHLRVTRTLNQTNGDGSANDGMDIALCRFHTGSNKLDFAGAHRPLYLVRNNELTEIKANKYPIGGMHYRNRQPFTNHELILEKHDFIVMNTDGLPDQFGGLDGKSKLMSQGVKDLALKCATISSDAITQKINNEFETWKGEHKQMDDVLLIAIKHNN